METTFVGRWWRQYTCFASYNLTNSHTPYIAFLAHCVWVWCKRSSIIKYWISALLICRKPNDVILQKRNQPKTESAYRFSTFTKIYEYIYVFSALLTGFQIMNILCGLQDHTIYLYNHNHAEVNPRPSIHVVQCGGLEQAKMAYLKKIQVTCIRII